METAQSKRTTALGAVIAISSALAIGAFLVVAPVVRAIVPITQLPAPLPDHHQHAETLLMVFAFAVLLPLAAWLGPRLCDRIAACAGEQALTAIGALLTGGLAVVLLLARAGGEIALFAGAVAWALAVAVLLRRATSQAPWGSAERLGAAAGTLWLIAVCLLAGASLSFTALHSISWLVFALGAIAVAGFVLAGDRIRVPRLPRGIGITADVAVAVLLLFAVPNLVVFVTGTPSRADAFQTSIIEFHQDFFLGPANQVLHGGAMLVDVIAQYGVGSIYFLAGVFNLIPIGDGTLGFIEGILSALMFIGVWAAMRIAGVSRLLAGTAMAVAVIALVYGLQYPLGGLLQHGAIRFGLPVGVLVGAVAEARWPERAILGRGLQLLTVAVSSIWALEAFGYTMLTALTVGGLYVYLAPAGERRRVALVWVAQLAAACVVAHLLLAGITLAARGELPDWGSYLKTLKEFLFGKIGDLTYDFSRFSPGLLLGAIYLVSGIALIVVLRRRPVLARNRRPLIFAIAATTAFGVALFTYIDNRSADHIVPYVSLPAVALAPLWLTLADSPALAVGQVVRRGMWAFSLGVAVLLVAVAASSAGTRFHQSALALAVPGGASLTSALDRLWHPPPLHAQAIDGPELLATYMPDETHSSVLTSADLSIEILTRAQRGSAVPLGDPWEDSFVPYDHLDALGDYVDGLQAGDRLLLDQPAFERFRLYRRDPQADPLDPSADKQTLIPSGLASLQEWVLKEIGQRWDLKTVAKTADGLRVVQLVPQQGA